MAKKKKWNSEKMLGISAMLMSFITLIIFIYQTDLMRKQNDLSIRPYLTISISDNNENHEFSLSLINNGVGPAIIDRIRFKYKGEFSDLEDYNNEVSEYFKLRIPKLDTIEFNQKATLNRGLAIPANESYKFLEVSDSKEDYNLFRNRINELLAEDFYLEIIYKSIQNERWIISNHSEEPKKIDN